MERLLAYWARYLVAEAAEKRRHGRHSPFVGLASMWKALYAHRTAGDTFWVEGRPLAHLLAIRRGGGGGGGDSWRSKVYLFNDTIEHWIVGLLRERQRAQTRTLGSKPRSLHALLQRPSLSLSRASPTTPRYASSVPNSLSSFLFILSLFKLSPPKKK